MHRAARAGLAAIGAAVALIVALELAYATEFTLVRRTISQHGLGPRGWVFVLAMVLLAAGSLAIAASLARRRLGRAAAAGVAALVVWSAGLLVVGLVPKHDWSVGPSLNGHIHRAAGIVAFLSLPPAALLISARRWRDAPRRRAARLTALLSAASLLWIAAIAVEVVLATRAGLAWWRVMPFGAIERGLALIEIAALAGLGFLAARRPPVRAAEPAPAAAAPTRAGR